MAEDDDERAIEVRSLDGTSTVVRVSPDSTVADLKNLLKGSFPPAKKSPDFRLFFKGDQLSVGRRIDEHPIERGEFVVLVPFAKRARGCEAPEGLRSGSAKPSKAHREGEASRHADTAWLDIMEDLRSLSDAAGDASPASNTVEPSVAACPKKQNVPRKRSAGKSYLEMKGGNGETDTHFLRGLLHKSSSISHIQSSRQSSSQIRGSATCLSDPHTGKCLFVEESCGNSKEADQCMCPAWLKRLVKCFSFLNVAHSFLLMQNRCIEWGHLKEALGQPCGSETEDVSILDVEHLMALCPKVLMLGKQETVMDKCGDAVFVLDSSAESEDQPGQTINYGMHLSRTSTVSAIEKRENAFKTDLCRMIRFASSKASSCNKKPSLISLEELISLKDVSVFSGACEAKLVKSRSVASGTHSRCLCHGTNLLQPLQMVEHLQKGFGIQGQIVHMEEIAAKAAVYTELPSDLSENTKAALKQMGIYRLYSHQADAVRASLSRKNIVVATSTSSGKSLCYNIPVIEELSQNSSSCALYVFPTKALAQDQLRALLEMTRGFVTSIDIGVYDGDTPQNDRAWIRDNVRLLITNPDMLHVSILPFHGQFQRLLSNLRFIVIDEAHTYTGALGCHTSLILRRLRRICSHVYGIDPSFIFCTATSGNPREHAMEVANLQSLDLIQNDGSPCGPKFFLLWNPPLRFQSGSRTHASRAKQKSGDKAVNRRSSPLFEVSCLLAEMVQHGLRCIAFCKTRKLCELVLCYTREILGQAAPDLVDSVSAYRGGYIAQDRRNIEIDLFGGRLRGVVATNALELGIDVGHIDATLHLGFPGTYASFWQQAGRSGRRMRPSLAVYVAFEGPLDQYFMKFPHKLFRNPIEYCKVDAYNQQVLEQHLSCAAFELPLSLDVDEKYFGNGLSNAILALKMSGHLSDDSSCKIWSYIGPEIEVPQRVSLAKKCIFGVMNMKKPSQMVSIRAIETEKYRVVDMQSNESLEEIEESRAFFQVYEGAVYINQGITYLVKSLDLSAKIALCQKADLKYYTKTRDYTDIHVNGGDLAYPLMVSEFLNLRIIAQSNPCKVTTNWFGFYRIWRGSNQIFDRVDLSLPPYSYDSQAVYVRVPPFIRTSVEAQNLSFRAGQHAASHALLNLAPLYLMCNVSDLSTECANPHETRDIPDRLLLYDQHPGGIGLSMRLQPLFGELLSDALRLITSCCCSVDVGCPNCIQSLTCHEYNEVLDKNAAIMILKIQCPKLTPDERQTAYNSDNEIVTFKYVACGEPESLAVVTYTTGRLVNKVVRRTQDTFVIAGTYAGSFYAVVSKGLFSDIAVLVVQRSSLERRPMFSRGCKGDASLVAASVGAKSMSHPTQMVLSIVVSAAYKVLCFSIVT